MPVYQTKENDVLDKICFKHYSHIRGTVEAVLAANPGLADHGPVLPAGVLISLPMLPEATPQKKTIRLWD